MRALFVTLSLLLSGAGCAQSVWLELGPAYLEVRGEERSSYQATFKFGLRGLLPIGERNSLYLAPHIYTSGSAGLDGGLWIRFPSDLEDVEGLSSYAGAGLALERGAFGLVLSAGLSYELNRDLSVAFVYTHRPLLIPRLSQTFDLSAGLALRLGN